MTIVRNLLLCNHPICDYMWLSIICNYVLSFLQLLTVLLKLLFILWLWCKYKIAHLFISINSFNFSSKNRLICSFNHKINYNSVISYGVIIHLMYIKILWTTLRIYLACIQCILNMFWHYNKRCLYMLNDFNGFWMNSLVVVNNT